MSTSAEKVESNESKSKPKGEASRPTGAEKQNTTLRRKEKDGAKATKASDNPATRDPHMKYFTRLGIVHKSEAYPQNPKRLSLHAGHYSNHYKVHSHSKNVASGKPRRAATVLGSNVVATTTTTSSSSFAQEGGGYPDHRGSVAGFPVNGAPADGAYLSETLPATTDAPREGNADEDVSTTQSDAIIRAREGATGNGTMVRSASLQAMWTHSAEAQADAEDPLPHRNKWLSMSDFSSLLSQNRFSSGLEQIQNETASVKAGLLVEPGTSSVIVHHEPAMPRSRTRSSSQPPKSEHKVKTASPLTTTTTSSPLIPTIPEEKDYFQVTSELDRENLHFPVSEALLTAIERYKSSFMEQEDDIEEDYRPFGSHVPPLQDVSHDNQASPSQNHSHDNHAPLNDLDFPESQQSEDGRTGDEAARKLFFFLAGHLKELQPDRPVLNCLQLPLKLVMSLCDDTHLLKSLDAACNKRSGDWSPPKAKILLEVFTPPKNFEQALIAQGYRCTGCGMTLDSNHSRYFRFCYYTGKYFCQNCHISTLWVVPAYILEYWSFKKLPVSNFARDLLAKIYCEPVFKITSKICTKIPQLSAAKDLRMQLISVKKYLRSCKELSAQSLNRTFDGYIPWTTDTLHYSLDDLMMVKTQGTRMRHLRSMLADGVRHIMSCATCHGNGFVCEFCRNDQDILFPFELEKVMTCRDCMGCFHKTCFAGKGCPRCTRLQRRRTVLLSDDEICDLPQQPHAIPEESWDVSCDH
ncbi:hypothetical protein EMCRGX_G026091 [Ephydatia muelleri]